MMKSNNTIVVWFTGLSGSGKTTISIALNKKLTKAGKSVHIIDGDFVRESLHKSLGFSRKDIRENNRLIAELVKDQLYKFDFILVPIISPYTKDRNMAKKIIGNKHFIELFIKTPLDKCIERDPKGLYKKVLNGEIYDFIGMSDVNPYEEPLLADIEVDTSEASISEVVQDILNNLDKMGLYEMKINE